MDAVQEQRLPNWREIAAAIAALNLGLDDTEYVGGVIWQGLTLRRAAGDLDWQKTTITGRLAKWATRDGGRAGDVATKLRKVS